MAPPAFSEDDRHFMRVALSLSKRGLGNVWPNPSVGCVLVSASGVIVGRGHTRPGGRPHAERVALDMAGDLARGATAYVTLEPCSHFGKSPPCAAGLIEAGVTRVVSALTDPYDRVSGRGHAMLRDAGISVDVGLFCDEARKINEGFLSRVERKRPFVTLKLAATMDARSATRSGESQWITGDAARVAFDIEAESASVRDAYGRNSHGQGLANTDTCYGPITMPFWLGRKLFLQMTRR